MREKTLAAHMCEPKRRWVQKDEKRVRHALYAFQRFYKLSAGSKKEKTYEEFAKSLTTMLLSSLVVLLVMSGLYILRSILTMLLPVVLN